MDPYGHCQRQRYPMVDSRYLNIPEQIGFSRFRPPNPRFINYHPRSHFPHQIPFAHERFGVRNGPNFCNNQNFIPRVNQHRGSWRPRTNHTSFNSPIEVWISNCSLILCLVVKLHDNLHYISFIRIREISTVKLVIVPSRALTSISSISTIMKL